jgi:glyoxylase-like metal-dependent hydrolase (beta-lactamase superfamily II)
MKKMFKLGLIPLLLTMPALSSAQQDINKVEIQTVAVTKDIYMLMGQGGNIGVSAGEDGVFMIDDQFAPLSAKIRKSVSAISKKPIRFLLNTHWHFDHTGGNEAFSQEGALIIAHNNVRERMANGQFVQAFNMDIPPANPAALPVLTFDKDITFHWNNDVIRVEHPAPAHTDGDAVVFFESANVVHMGDLYWNGLYPVIDADSGGSTSGLVRGVREVLARIDNNTKVIPGHGLLASKVELENYLHMLTTVNDRVSKLRAEGKTLEQVIAAKPTADFDSTWGVAYLNGDQWTTMVYLAP